MKKSDMELIEKLEKRIIQLENPVHYENGQEVRFEIEGENREQIGIVIDSRMFYKGIAPDYLIGAYIPFDFRKYQVLCKGKKHWFTYENLSGRNKQ